MKFSRSLAQSPIETLSAFVLVGVGVYVSSIGSSAASHKTGLLVAGGLLTTFGGVLFAWVVSKAFATERARAEFQQQLGHLSRSLGQAAGQISRAVEQSQTEDVSSETGLALISQANRIIYGQVSEISVIRGTGFDPAYLLETATTLDDLARQMASDGDRSGELESVRRQLQEVRTSLGGADPARTYSISSVKCPECREPMEVRLGDVPGETAATVCASCGIRFNAHRGADGMAFSRPIGPAVGSTAPKKQERWRFTCPECGRSASAAGGEGLKTMVCFGCFKPLEVDLGAHSVLVGEGRFEHGIATITGTKGARPLLECPTCHESFNAFLRVGDDLAAICYRDRQVLLVAHAVFEAWKAGNGRASGGEGERLGSGGGETSLSESGS